jgi:hypothetical protein
VQSVHNCREYIRIARVCWNFDGHLAVNGKDKFSVVRSHLLAMLQCHLMFIAHMMDIWSLLSSRSVTTLEQCLAIFDLILERNGISSSINNGDHKKESLTLRQIKIGDFGDRLY